MLKYFRQRRKSHELTTIWWPFAAPYGVLLTTFVMFLNISPRWIEMGALPIDLAVGSDQAGQSLAVLRMRAGRTARLSYCRSDRSPVLRDTIASCEQREFGVIPGLPLPKQLLDLSSKWQIVGDEAEIDLPADPFFRTYFRDESPDRPHPQGTPRDNLPQMLLAEEYRSSLNWAGMRAALLEAMLIGLPSNVVLIEAEDNTPVEAIVGAADLCHSLDLRPVLKLR